MSKEKKTDLVRVTFSIPREKLAQIDAYVESNFLTRTKWFNDATNIKLKKDKQNDLEDIIKGK